VFAAVGLFATGLFGSPEQSLQASLRPVSLDRDRGEAALGDEASR